MNRPHGFRSATGAAGLSSLGSPGRAFVLALAVATSLCVVGCSDGNEPAPAGLPEGVTEFSPKVDPPKTAKPARGKHVDMGSSAPAT